MIPILGLYVDLIDVSSITEDAAEHYPGDTYDIAVGTQEVRVPGRD